MSPSASVASITIPHDTPSDHRPIMGDSTWSLSLASMRPPSPVSDMLKDFTKNATIDSSAGFSNSAEAMEIDESKMPSNFSSDNFMVIPNSPSLAPDPQHPNNELLNDSEQRWFSEFLNQVDVDQDFVFDFSLPDMPVLPISPPSPPPP
ncbi:uncharacterized protein VTP21DRAFT_90 [Calcarisporiella thermophila]|uniref:uncharacterized protein n=1 Tax=Calcarisporiella thermophila TaxID=911321 RepID=UPI0037441E21